MFMDNPKVLIIVPAYNESRAIRITVRDLKRMYPAYDVLVINDGSIDDTERQAESAGARVVSLPYNLGIGGAIQTGYQVAHAESYDATIQIDGDAQHDPVFLNDVLSPVLKGELDLCVGSRFLSEASTFKSTFMRRLGIRFFASLLRGLTGTNLTDPTSGFRATSKPLIQHFSEYYPIDFPEPEAIKMAKRFSLRVGEVPVNMRKRLGGVSSIRYLSTLYYMIKVTFAILIDSLKSKT